MAPVCGSMATAPLGGPVALSAAYAACWAAGLMVSWTVAPFLGLPVTRSMQVAHGEPGVGAGQQLVLRALDARRALYGRVVAGHRRVPARSG